MYKKQTSKHLNKQKNNNKKQVTSTKNKQTSQRVIPWNMLPDKILSGIIVASILFFYVYLFYFSSQLIKSKNSVT